METPPSSYSSHEKGSGTVVPAAKEEHRAFLDHLLKTTVDMGQARKDMLNSETKYWEFLRKEEKKEKMQQKMKGLKVSEVAEKSDSSEVEDEFIAEMLKMEKMVKKRRSERSAAEKQKREMEQNVKDVLNVTMNSNVFEAVQQVAHERKMPAPVHPVFRKLFKF